MSYLSSVFGSLILPVAQGGLLTLPFCYDGQQDCDHEIIETVEELSDLETCFSELENKQPEAYGIIGGRSQSIFGDLIAGSSGAKLEHKVDEFSCSISISDNQYDNNPPLYHASFNSFSSDSSYEMTSIAMPICGDGSPGYSNQHFYVSVEPEITVSSISSAMLGRSILMEPLGEEVIVMNSWQFNQTAQGQRMEATMDAIEDNVNRPYVLDMARQSGLMDNVMPSACMTS